MVSYLTTLFLGKPSGSSLQVLSPVEKGIFFPRQNVPDARVNLKASPLCVNKMQI